MHQAIAVASTASPSVVPHLLFRNNSSNIMAMKRTKSGMRSVQVASCHSRTALESPNNHLQSKKATPEEVRKHLTELRQDKDGNDMWNEAPTRKDAVEQRQDSNDGEW